MSYHYHPRYGLGYDESIDDYKVVGFFCSSICFCEVQVMVYTLRSDSWRRIGDFPPRCFPQGVGTFVNGALHWIVGNESNDNIVSLDLAKETYGEVLEPEYGYGYLHEMLDVLNGCLCMVRYCNACADVWIMKEYGIRESWTKLVVIPYTSHPIERLCILKNGEFLLRIQSHLVHYIPKDGTFSHLTVPNCPRYFDEYPYVESLVSPHIDADYGV
ncbi:F-box/kelch-repeat protein At3g23880-like [Rhododendron vialii]|uniref:F-box/kelch-repeat protein At3g23880-like n=1 Tax=Rhododendron vialii TaxID=182163 RepID=UPI00265FC824|nr:F-box/kelch-repeat protein At3g23880-like [Rhododendron vialii]